MLLNKKHIFWVMIIMIVMMISFIAGIAVASYFQLKDSPEAANLLLINSAKQKIAQLIEENEYLKSLNDLEEILWTTGQEEYDPDNKNCLHFSQNLKNRLEEKGIRSSIVKGTWGDRNHYWIMIWVESTEGDFIKPTENYIVEEIIN